MGMRDTADKIAVSIDPLQPFTIGRDVYRYNPNRQQLLSWIMKKARSRPTETHIFGHSEKAPLPNWVKFTGSDESSQQTTGLTFENGATRLTRYNRIYVARTGEVIYLTAAMSGNNTGAVTRNHGSSGTPLLRKDDKCKILLPLKMEGADMALGLTGGVVYKAFNTSIIEKPIQLTGTKAAERHLDGDPFLSALSDTWEDTQDQLESEFLFGAKVADDTGAYPLHATEGYMNYISTHVYALAGYMTRMDLWDILMTWKLWNKEGGAIATSGQIIHIINTMAFGKMIYTNQDMKADGINIDTVKTPAMTVDLVEIDLFGQEHNLMGIGLLIPNPAKGQGIDYRPLVANDNRDIRYKPVNRDEKDAKEGMIHGEYGWEFFGEERNGVFTGVEF